MLRFLSLAVALLSVSAHAAENFSFGMGLSFTCYGSNCPEHKAVLRQLSTDQIELKKVVSVDGYEVWSGKKTVEYPVLNHNCLVEVTASRYYMASQSWVILGAVLRCEETSAAIISFKVPEHGEFPTIVLSGPLVKINESQASPMLYLGAPGLVVNREAD